MELVAAERINGIAEEYSFTPAIVELFLMDHLVHQRVTEKIECVTKGGMCMPLYCPNGDLQRLSVDVDLATKATADNVESAVKRADSLSNVIKVEKHIPQLATPKSNLVTYKVRYKSCFNQTRTVKVDFLYGLNLDYDTRTVPAGKTIGWFETTHEMNVLTRSALMADKFGTFATGTIGLNASRVSEIEKQVFDMGVLLSGSTVGDVVGFFTEFDHMLENEKTINDKPMLTAQDVVDSAKKTLKQMLNVSGDVRFGGESKKGYDDFKSQYISKNNPYQKSDRHANVLLAKVLSRLTEQVLNGKDDDAAAAEMYRIVADVGNLHDYNDVRELYGQSARSATGISERHLGRMDARHAFLLCAHAAMAPGQGA